MDKLTDTEVADRITELEGWKLRDDHLEKDFEFVDFLTNSFYEPSGIDCRGTQSPL